MAWYAYCITEQQAFLNGTRARRPVLIETLQGINGTKVFAYPSGDFAVIVSEYIANGQLTQKSIVDHAKVISDCFRSATVLPFRFGTVFETDEALRRAVRGNRKAFMENVSRLRGKAEMRLKLVVKDGTLFEANADAPLPNTVGGEYLTRLREKAAKQRERQTKARSLSMQVSKLFNPLDEDVCCKKSESGSLMIDIAHLVDRKAVEKYQNRISMATRQLKNVEVAITGPWPPYHFVGEKGRLGHS